MGATKAKSPSEGYSVWRRFRWLVLALVLGALLASPYGPMEPWIAARLGALATAIPVLWIIPLACAIAAMSESVVRKDVLALAVTLLLSVAFVVGAKAWLGNDALCFAQWKAKFQSCEPERQVAVEWFLALPPGDSSSHFNSAPEPVRRLATGRRIEVNVDEKNVRWLGIAILSTGIDNDCVFLWSDSGQPPGERAYPVVVRSWPMGGGWYFARTT